MKQQRFLLIAAVFGVELAGVEGRVEIARIGIGVAVYRSSGAIEGFLYILDPDQGLGPAIRSFLADRALETTAEPIQHLVRDAGRGWNDRTRGRKHETVLGRAGTKDGQ